MSRAIRLLLMSVRAIGIIAVTVIVVRALDARTLPDLHAWHEVRFDTEFRADRDKDVQTLAAYLEVEEAVFSELNEKVYSGPSTADVSSVSRFNATSVFRSQNHEIDWNQTIELVPERPSGVVLMLHGLTDSPYSMRSTAELFYSYDYHVLVPRLPGHGTAPAGILQARWEDWQAVVEMGAEHLRAEAGSDLPFVIVGYSNGGALAVNYTLDSLDHDTLRVPDRLILMSPAIGVTPFAFFASWNRSLSWIPFFSKFAWESIVPEYDPYKYNSFPKSAGNETYELAKRVQKRLDALPADDHAHVPPIITFAPVVDSTVSSEATVDHLYAKLNRPQDELVFYDINRWGDMVQFFVSDYSALLRRVERDAKRKYRFTVVQNLSGDTRKVVATSDQDSRTTMKQLDTEWPLGIYSLSHVAIPFSANDIWYGDGSSSSQHHVNLGRLNTYGEKNLLRISPAQIMRLRHNPFYSYQARRIAELLQTSSGTL